MKKFLAIVLVCLMTAMLSVAALAQTWNGDFYGDIELGVKKADPANVVKDGIIGANEYSRLDIDTTEDGTPLDVNFSTNGQWDYAMELLSSIEYYFSWDETHGLNFAVKIKPNSEVFNQVFEETLSNDELHDHFLSQMGFALAACDSNQNDASVNDGRCLFYYAVGKRTDTGAYLKGHYDQFGHVGNYDPIPGQDFIINYPGDGTAILEWSVPFAVIAPGGAAGAGDSLFISVSATSGSADYATVKEDGFSDLGGCLAAVTLGAGYASQINAGYGSHVEAVLLSEAVSGNNQGGGNDETGGQGAGTQVVTEIETVLTTDEEGNTVVETRIVPKNVPASDSNKTNTGKRTGDPMIIIAAISAVSACGVVVFKKKH